MWGTSAGPAPRSVFSSHRGADARSPTRTYQVMRKQAAAAALAQRRRKERRALFAFPRSADHAPIDVITRVAGLLAPANRARVGMVDYDTLADDLANSDSNLLSGLAAYMHDRLALVGR